MAADPPPASKIRADQVGYPAGAAKVAVVVAPEAERFAVHRIADGEKVFEGELTAATRDQLSGDTVRSADFSSVREPGSYEVRVPGIGTSWPVRIAETPYRDLLWLTMRSYYGQRCGTAVDLGGGYAHPACHLQGAFHRSSGQVGPAPSHHGWHDAGDYGRYVVNSGIATGTLLWAYELFPRPLAALDLAIPESKDPTPDVLDEVRWNLEWMLSMQDRDGGVWPKQTSAQFPSFVAPHEDGSTSFVIGSGEPPFKSSCATADLAAVAAIAARVYRPWDEKFAIRAHSAALRAWGWLEKHPNATFSNPGGIGTGAYGDSNCLDERLWAAAEIWRTTGDAGAHAFFLARADAAIRAINSDDPPGWKNVGALAAWAYVLGGKGDEGLSKAIANRSVAAADAIAVRAAGNGWHSPLVEENFVWGSNGVAANYAMQLLVADAIRPKDEYRSAALDIVHYLLGRNPAGISYVTGAGPQSVRHPHHRPSGADAIDEPWPGLLAGGPDARRRDPLLRKLPRDTPPAKLYLDDEGSFASNEVAINWNAPLVFALAGLE
ncbi:MAG TPA: glycoside hydrolase family 9 protein [Thermoanaerobaculia bacterium]|nr:glycoside hydrolase family 9 protein [Thermoanaerobaculia bacterium]